MLGNAMMKNKNPMDTFATEKRTKTKGIFIEKKQS